MKLTRTVRRIGKAVLTGSVLAPLVFGACAPAWAVGQFVVTPVRIFMQPRDRAAAVTISNEGDEEMVMQADVFVWKQKPGGEDELTLSEDLFLSPPIIKLAPKSRQVVRLAMVRPARSAEQLTYRMIVREIPEARPNANDVQVQIALAFSMPVFVTPPGAKSRVECAVERTAADAVRVACENAGTAYAQVREFVLSGPAGDKLASRETGIYILPSIKRTFDIKRAEGPIPGGKATLAVTLDDGSTRTFDVTVAE
jgi:fimbrial chaperone protein